MKEDRLIVGTIAAFAGCIFNIASGFLFKSLGLTDRAFYDFSTTLYGKVTYENEGFWGFLLGVLTEAAVCLIFGIIFAYILEVTPNQIPI